MSKIIVLIVIGFVTLFSWCCCKVSGEADKSFNEVFYQKGKEE